MLGLNYFRKRKDQQRLKYIEENTLEEWKDFSFKLFDLDAEDIISEKANYLQWHASNDCCLNCEKIAKYNKYGIDHGVYKISDIDDLKKHIHIGCQCRIFSYTSDSLPVETYWNRNPLTGKGYTVQAKTFD